MIENQRPIEDLLKLSYAKKYDEMSNDEIEQVITARAKIEADRLGFEQKQKAISDALENQADYYKSLAEAKSNDVEMSDLTRKMQEDTHKEFEKTNQLIEAIYKAAEITRY